MNEKEIADRINDNFGIVMILMKTNLKMLMTQMITISEQKVMNGLNRIILIDKIRMSTING